MLKIEFLKFLQDADICKEIYDIIRHSGKPTGSQIPESAKKFPTKVEFLSFLQDTEVCKEIFNIILRGGKPAVEVTKPKAIFAGGVEDAISAARQQVRDRITGKISNRISNSNYSDSSTDWQSPDERISTLNDRLALLKDTEHSLKRKNPTTRKIPSNGKFTLIVERPCPVCGQNTRVIQNKPNIVAENIDFDFCIHYKDFDPYLYTIWVCEKCGYAADEGKFQEKMLDRIRKPLENFLMENDFTTPFVAERSIDEALTLYEMAIQFNKIFEKSLGRQALLYQKMAWICRIEQEAEKERDFILKTAELLEQSLSTERYPIGKMTEDLATFTIGVNYFMLGDFENATKFLAKIINSNHVRVIAPKLYEKARYIWQDLRQFNSIRR